MAKIIRGLAPKYGVYNIFSDFCELGACAYSNAVDRHNYQQREERYLNTIKKYDSLEERKQFPTLLGMLTEELERAPRDVMGELFHELEIHNEHAGQFFTPYDLCRMISEMAFNPDEVIRKIDGQGFITLQEPAVGAGAMVIAFANVMLRKGINYQQCLHVSAIDIDRRCVHMAYLQFTLLNIPAVVYLGNTLTMEIHEAWYTPAHILGGWHYRLRENRTPAVADPQPLEQLSEVSQRIALHLSKQMDFY
ncbi:N-6 DNA methylase [Tellurirhabdus bombi]|uniref:N-6 DNA methylase n=1 Tax=Tellurirhabdus bombi TaxID=2907205 RepID=UPI001F1BCC9D|nr:N-6 DNA methylase [Tellurirhabdus bombi]